MSIYNAARLFDDIDDWIQFSRKNFDARWLSRNDKSSETRKSLYVTKTAVDSQNKTVVLHGVFGNSYRDVYIRRIEVVYDYDGHFTISYKEQLDSALDYFEAVERIKDYAK